MHIVMVQFHVKEESLDAFLEASKDDGRGSVSHEYGCRRFDIIQDSETPTRIAFCEVYDDQAAFEAHTKMAHFEQWQKAVDGMNEGDPKVAHCRNVFPNDYGQFGSAISGVDESFFSGNLHIIHAALPVKPERVNGFIEAVKLDGIGSTWNEPGCLRFDVYQNIDQPAELWLYEVYANPEAFQYHTTTPHIEKWRDTVNDWYAGERPPGVRGRNIWPPDNWNWGSGKPRA